MRLERSGSIRCPKLAGPAGQILPLFFVLLKSSRILVKIRCNFYMNAILKFGPFMVSGYSHRDQVFVGIKACLSIKLHGVSLNRHKTE